MKTKNHPSSPSIVKYDLSTLFPLIAGISVIFLCFLIVRGYIITGNRTSIVIQPGGVTYLGR